MMERGREFSAGSPEVTSEIFSCPQMPYSPKKKKNKIKNKKRFSDDQIRLLESIFESDNKLDSRKKLQLARDLGLQPRQVAIWFQNRRARWKSKQIEHDYKALRANYDSLAFRFESLKKEKESLLSELQMLNDKLHKKLEDENRSIKDKDLKGSTKLLEPGEAKLSFLEEGLGQRGYMRSHTDHNSTGNWQSGEEVRKLLNVESIAGNSSESPEKLYGGFDSCGLLDPSSSSSHWLNFWV